MSETININSFNTKGLGMKTKRIAIFNWLKTQYTGIYLLQETHSTSESVALWEREWGGKIIFSHGESNSSLINSK